MTRASGAGSRWGGIGLLVIGLLFSGLAVGEESITRIAFGSCANQNRNQTIWDSIIEQEPELFLFLGDNVYADTEDMTEMWEAYTQLALKPGYQLLRQTCPVLAVWDDHDYGENDAGAAYPMREGAEKLFHEFFGTPADAPSRQRPGIYDVHYFGDAGRRLQIIRLDTRYFKSEPTRLPKRTRHGPYGKNLDKEATILGAAQWQWLEETLREPADLRIVMSSIQCIPSDHRWENWENFPLERKRFFDLLKTTNTGPLLILSGDRHMGEISKLGIDDPLSPGFPVFEVTSSGLTNAGGGQRGEPNRHRVSATNFQSRNFGFLQIDWDALNVTLQLRDIDGEVVDSYEAEMTFAEESR